MRILEKLQKIPKNSVPQKVYQVSSGIKNYFIIWKSGSITKGQKQNVFGLSRKKRFFNFFEKEF